MRTDGFRIVVNPIDYTDSYEIVPIDVDNHNGTRTFFSPSGDQWVGHTINWRDSIPKDKINPMTIPSEWAKELYSQLHKVFGEKKSPEFETEIKAVRYHLEDMRKLVFESKK